jgi:predicted DNA-binding protein (MmcQ/YjbR family)
MTLDELKRYLRSKPGATEETPFGPEHLVYKVMGKIFAVVGWDEEPVTMSLKCDPEGVEVLRKVFRSVTPAPYFDKRHWNVVALDGSIPVPSWRRWSTTVRPGRRGTHATQRESLRRIGHSRSR